MIEVNARRISMVSRRQRRCEGVAGVVEMENV